MFVSSQPSDIPLFYRQVAAEDSLWVGREWLLRPTTEVSASGHGGLESRALAFTPGRSDGIAVALLCSLVLLMVIKRWRKPSFRDEVSNFFFPIHSMNREGGDSSNKEGVRILVALFACIQMALMIYAFTYKQVVFTSVWSTWQLIGLLILVCASFLVLKQLLYKFVHSVFFDSTQIRLWRNQYAFLFTVESYLLFPVLLLFVYVLPDPQWVLYTGAIVLLTAKIMLLLKCFSTFFGKIYGVPQLFVYLCALEIVPLLVLWTFFSEIIHSLTII